MKRRLLRWLSRLFLFDLDWYDEMGEIAETSRRRRLSYEIGEVPPRDTRDFAETLAPPFWRQDRRQKGGRGR